MRGRNGLLISLGAFAFALTACGGGGGGGLPTPTPTPFVSPTPTPTPTATPFGTKTFNASLNCTTQGAPQSVARQSFSARNRVPFNDGTGRLPNHAAANGYAPGVIEVAYNSTDFATRRATLSRVASNVGASEGRTMEFPAMGRIVQILHVTPGQEDAAIAQLRTNSLVKSVSRAALRYTMSTNAALAFPNDPYFNGFAPGNTPPVYQNQVGVSSWTLGQWDVHAICAANAWAYGKTNSTGNIFANALGGTAKIAIIDTGADMTHPELSGRIVYSESDINGVTTVGPVTDNDGHGTNVSGIAGAAANNGLGFAGVAYAAPLMIFKVFPDPPCGSGGCTAQASDVGLAINHAVAQGAKVISMSLGAPTADPAEEDAVASAIAANVVVVAASGNETKSTLDFPAADAGVIAVGASTLDDSGSVINETVASYSNYDATHPTSWGVVAPGGDPSGSSDADDLHWIENIYTSTASDSSSRCTPDFGSSNPTKDCRILIAGTSQATPHVAGAAALLLSVKPALTPSQVFSAICSTATTIPGATKAGCGRLNVYRAMAQVLGDPSP